MQKQKLTSYIHSYAETCVQSQMYKTSIHTFITKLTYSRVIKIFFFSVFLFSIQSNSQKQLRNENYKHFSTVRSVSFILSERGLPEGCRHSVFKEIWVVVLGTHDHVIPVSPLNKKISSLATLSLFHALVMHKRGRN